MLHFLPASLLGVISLLLFVLNTLWWGGILLLFACIKLIVPHPGIKERISKVLVLIAEIWVEGNSGILWLTHPIEWDVRGVSELSLDASYLVICNHQSWVDIFVLQHIFKRRIPFMKFFIKQELIWIPILGAAWWAMEFPFLKRYSRQFLEKHPELRGKDLETTRKHCEKFKNTPVSVISFVEGTRFTPPKHAAQDSPFPHLLRPKAGGVATVLTSMGDYLSQVLDTTIIYPDNRATLNFWDLLSGRIPRIVVRVEPLPIPDNVAGKNYDQDHNFRQSVQGWINGIWGVKSRRIETILAELGKSSNR